MSTKATARLYLISILLMSVLTQGILFCAMDIAQETATTAEQEDELTKALALQEKIEAYYANQNSQAESDLQEFLTLLFKENQERFFRAREKHLQLLPNDYREVIVETEKLYTDVINSMNITAVISFYCEYVMQQIAQRKDIPMLEGEVREQLIDLLVYCYQSLKNGSFMLLLQGADDAVLKPGALDQMAGMTSQMQQMLQGMMMPTLYLSRDDLKKMIDLLISLQEAISTGENQDHHFSDSLGVFNAFLQATYDKNSNKLSELMLGLVNDNFQVMHEKIKNMVIWLQQKKDESAQQGEVELRDAYDFFLSNTKQGFRKYARSLAAFERIKNSTNLQATNQRYAIFKMITYGYYIGHGFYELYMKDLYAKYDKEVTFFSYPNLADWAFCGALSGWMFFNHQTDLMNTQLFTRLIGTQSVLKPLDTHMLIQLNAMAALQVLPVFFAPKIYVSRPGRVGRCIEKIGTAWLYFHIFEQGLFNGKVDLLEWPNDNKHMREAILFAINQGKYYLGQRAEYAVARKFKPKTLEKAYDYSMGIVNPEIAELVVESLVDLSLLFCIPKNRYILTEALDNARTSILIHRKITEDALCKGLLLDEGKSQEDAQKAIAVGRSGLVSELRPKLKTSGDYNGSVLENLDNLKLMNDRDLFEALRLQGNAAIVADNAYFTSLNGQDVNTVFSKFFLDKVAKITPNDVFKSSFGSSFQRYIDKYYAHADPGVDNVYKLYFQQKLLSYTAKSVGGFWGRKAFHRYGKNIGSALSTGADALAEILEACWLISPESLDSYYDFKKELSDEWNDTIVEIKEILLQCFDMHSLIRESIIQQLKQIHILDENENDPTEQNRSIIYFVVNYLSNPLMLRNIKIFRLLTIHDASKIIRGFERDKDNIALVIDNIVDAIQANIAGMCGEWIGEKLADTVATNYFWSREASPTSRFAEAIGLKSIKNNWF